MCTTRRRFASVSLALASASPARTRRASACSSSRSRTGIRLTSLRYTVRLARLVSRVSGRTSSSTASRRGSSGSSGMSSSASLVIGGFVPDVGDLRRSGRRRQQVERVVDRALVADFEVEVVRGGPSRAADLADHLPGLDHVTNMNEILKMMGVNSYEVVTVVYLHNVAVAGLHPARRDDSRGGGEDGGPKTGLDVDPPVPPAAARSEEHTSELQSPCNLVCRLLLEKKKKVQNHIISLQIQKNK